MDSRFVVITIFFAFIGCAISFPPKSILHDGNTATEKENFFIELHNLTSSTTTTPSITTPTNTTPTNTTPTNTTPTTTTPSTTTPTNTTPLTTTPSTTTPIPSTIPSNRTTPVPSTTPSKTTPSSTISTPEVPTSTVAPTAMTTVIPGGNTKGREFDGPSFIGGIVLTVGLTAIGFIAFKFYIAGKGGDSKYRTLY